MLKRALLVGINRYAVKPLGGCVNDVLQIQDMLRSKFGFQPSDIRVLTDGDATRKGIEAGLDWLVAPGEGGGAGDVRVFHYSGHGSQVEDKDQEEPDGADECLVPIDADRSGYLIDDDLCRLYGHVPAGSNLTLIMDSCHSGGAQRGDDDSVFRFVDPPAAEMAAIERARLAYQERREEHILDKLRTIRSKSEDELLALIRSERLSFDKKRRQFGDVDNRESNLLIAGCRSDQSSSDATIAGARHGALTYFLVKAVEAQGPSATYRQITTAVGPDLRRYRQTPQLEGTAAHKDWPIFAPFHS